MSTLTAKIPDNKYVLPKIISRWLDKRKFRPHKMRGVLIGCYIAIGIDDALFYRMVQSIVNSEDLPVYIPNLMIILMALLEVIASPLVAWFGSRRRRTTMLTPLFLMLLCSLSWLSLPLEGQPPETVPGLCNTGAATAKVQWSPALLGLRLGVLVCSSIVFQLARIALWTQGLGYIVEHDPNGASMHLGVVALIRTISLALDYPMIGLNVTFSHIIATIINILILILQMLYFMPSAKLQAEEHPKVPKNYRNFFARCSRVLANPLLLSQMVSLGLLAAVAWGIGFHNTDILKVKYLFPQRSTLISLFTEIFQYVVVLMSVLYIGAKWSGSTDTAFGNRRAVKQSITMAVLAGILCVVLALTVDCEHGQVAGLGSETYTNPKCSLKCGCTAWWWEFSPVCVPDDMTTYLSPCQAGCREFEDTGGLMVYKNCSCAAGERALAGACSDHVCRQAREMYRILYILLLCFCALGFQSHGSLLLQAAEARDKTLVLGLAGSVVAALAFGVGHVIFSSMGGAACVWFESSRCHMHSARLPVLLGLTGAGLAFASATVCTVTLVWLVKSKKTTHGTSL